MSLSAEHRGMLESESAIGPAVIEARGYRTVDKKAELFRIGFGVSQGQVPTLLIPIWGVSGEIVLYQHRPDQPRIRDGKPVRYEFPTGGKMAIDLHPFLRDKIRDPAVPLIITEGTKKADAAVSRGLCCAAVVGVWNWRGTNEHGGKTSLPDWEGIALKDQEGRGRQVYLCFDSDAMLKPAVHEALSRLAAFLKHRGAQVAFLYLPIGQGAAKTGLDDFFAAGHSVDDLLLLASPELRRPVLDTPIEETGNTSRPLPYTETPNGVVWEKPVREGTIPVPLTNFMARIVGDVEEDDGAETRRVFTVEAGLNGQTRRFNLAAEAFAAMNWPAAQLGARAILYPGQGTRDHARAAIQLLSRPEERRVRTHTGWIILPDGNAVYCHAGGIIGGTTDSAQPCTAMPEVRLIEALARFALPSPPQGEELRAAIRAVLNLWKLGRAEVVLPVCAAALRAVLGTADFSVFLAGPTGVFKSELAALVQQFYGPMMDSRHLPADWAATDNYLEGLAFSAKDALLVIDEFVPRGSVNDQQRHHAKADRVLRAQGNGAARGRMRADGTLRPARPPRGLILATGEDTPQGQSLRARMVIVEVSPGDIPADQLSLCQKDAAQGRYAQALAGFIAWIAPQYEEIQRRLRAEVAEIRDRKRIGSGHRRTPEVVANLGVGIRFFLWFATKVEAITDKEASDLAKAAWQALEQVAERQANHQESGEPTGRFCELIAATLASGKAHLASLSGGQPNFPAACGWREHKVGTGEFIQTEWRPSGERIGFINGEDLYLLPDAAYQAAQRLAAESGDGITVKPKTLSKRLHEKGLLVTTEEGRDRLNVRVTACGMRHNVLHLRVDTFLPESSQSYQQDQGNQPD